VLGRVRHEMQQRQDLAVEALRFSLRHRVTLAQRLIDTNLEVDAIGGRHTADAAGAQARRQFLAGEAAEDILDALGLLDRALNRGYRALALEEPDVAVVPVQGLESGVGQPDIEIDRVVLNGDRHARLLCDRAEEANRLALGSPFYRRWLQDDPGGSGRL